MMMCHVKDDIQRQWRATSRKTYNDNDVLRQGRHTTAACHVNEAHNDDNDGPDDANASSGSLGKFFIYLFINLILNLYYRLLQVLPTMHDDDVPCQGQHTRMTTCYVKDNIQWRATSRTTHNGGVPCQWGTQWWRRWPRRCKCIVWAIGKFFFCFFIHL